MTMLGRIACGLVLSLAVALPLVAGCGGSGEPIGSTSEALSCPTWCDDVPCRHADGTCGTSCNPCYCTRAGGTVDNSCGAEGSTVAPPTAAPSTGAQPSAVAAPQCATFCTDWPCRLPDGTCSYSCNSCTCAARGGTSDPTCPGLLVRAAPEGAAAAPAADTCTPPQRLCLSCSGATTFCALRCPECPPQD